MAAPGTTSRFSRSRGLPRSVHASWVASLREDPGHPARVLSWASAEGDGGTVYCIGSPAALSCGGEAGWRHVGWHQIEHGGWNGELSALTWVLLDGRRDALRTPDPGRLPELFRERVEATIVVQRFVSLAGERGVVVSARRDLGGEGEITWHTRLTRGLSERTPGVVEAVADALAEARAEYDLG